MRLSDATTKAIIERSGQLNKEQMAKLEREQENSDYSLQDLVTSYNLLTKKQLTKLYADYADIPFVELDPRNIDPKTLHLLPERTARQYNAIVFESDENTRHLAMEDPDDVQAVNFLTKQLGSNVKVYLATRDDILRTLDNYREDVGKELSEVIQVQQEKGGDERISEEDIAEDSPVAQTVNLLLEFAIRSNASDIHIEPREDYVQVRYRVDGVLKEVNRLPRDTLNAVISRIKILSNLKIDERRVPQDGRFKITTSGRRYALRVSTMPVAEGEKVAIRILDENSSAQSLADLGLWGRTLKVVTNSISQPHGMMLVTGPTGSGKSTTLFSVLTILNKESVNISTVEDPIEYRVPGVNQTQVNPKAGLTFANGLRSLLRQDPNIIMVGEIRDSETADLAVQAALTGHLVLTTLHTNNAATSLPRLLDMQIEPFLIASTVRSVVGQRLVRRLCDACRVSYAPSAEEQLEVIRMFELEGSMPAVNALEMQAVQEGLGAESQELSTTDTGIVRIFRASEEGCEECDGSGYKGRIGIYEALDNSDAVQQLIIGNATSNTIQNQAIKDGMITMQMDGLLKVLRGITSIDEVMRVTKE